MRVWKAAEWFRDCLRHGRYGIVSLLPREPVEGVYVITTCEWREGKCPSNSPGSVSLRPDRPHS